MVKIFGYASGNASEKSGCCMGPLIMQESKFLAENKNLSWISHLFPADAERKLDALQGTQALCTKLAHHTSSAVKANEKFVVLGGDHSVAIGTWSGVASAIGAPIGMIWVDAHLDSHTPDTSPSKNIHGMALAALMKHGPEELTDILADHPKVAKEHTVIIGARDYEPEEVNLLNNLGVTVIFMSEVIEKGLSATFKKAIAIASSNPNGFGLSIDIDAFEPEYAPATAILTSPGIIPNELIHELKTHIKDNPKLLGLEIAEFFPDLDKDHLTEAVIASLINSIF